MTQPAFFFDANLCTGCAACAIACQIENNRLPLPEKLSAPPWRTIYSRNPGNAADLPGFHLSLACNHCLEPACLKACPAAAISKDSLTGAVLIDPRRCIGCGYCAWACPYDAPKYDPAQGIMEKCTFCQPRLLAGSPPACVTACPTGALRLELLAQDIPGATTSISGFPKTTIKPAIRFEPLRIGTVMLSEAKHLIFSEDSSVAGPPQNDSIHKGDSSVAGQRLASQRLASQFRSALPHEQHVIASERSERSNLPITEKIATSAAGGLLAMTNSAAQEISLRHEWPLWLLTVTIPLLFAWFAAYPAASHLGWAWMDGIMGCLGALALLISTFHLGKPWRAWRAVLNANTSWLSREILFTSAFLALAGGAFGLARLSTNDFLHRSGALVQASLLIVGVLALLSMDMVYAVLRFQEEHPVELYRPRLQLHSGLVLLSGLYLAGIVALAGGVRGQALQTVLAGAGLACGALQLGLYANRHANREPANAWQAALRFLRVALGFALPGILLAASAPAWFAVACALLGSAIDRAEFYNMLKRVMPGW